MINSTYAKAYTEVLEIISHFSEQEYAKIPVEKREFYKNNMDRNYVFKIDPKIDLAKQNISKEANAVLVNLYREYFATKEQNIKIEQILKQNQEKEEQKKRNRYNPDELFKKANKQENINIEAPEEKANVELIEYKETFFAKFKKFIFKTLHISE